MKIHTFSTFIIGQIFNSLSCRNNILFERVVLIVENSPNQFLTFKFQFLYIFLATFLVNSIIPKSQKNTRTIL